MQLFRAGRKLNIKVKLSPEIALCEQFAGSFAGRFHVTGIVVHIEGPNGGHYKYCDFINCLLLDDSLVLPVSQDQIGALSPYLIYLARGSRPRAAAAAASAPVAVAAARPPVAPSRMRAEAVRPTVGPSVVPSVIVEQLASESKCEFDARRATIADRQKLHVLRTWQFAALRQRTAAVAATAAMAALRARAPQGSDFPDYDPPERCFMVVIFLRYAPVTTRSGRVAAHSVAPETELAMRL